MESLPPSVTARLAFSFLPFLLHLLSPSPASLSPSLPFLKWADALPRLGHPFSLQTGAMWTRSPRFVGSRRPEFLSSIEVKLLSVWNSLLYFNIFHVIPMVTVKKILKADSSINCLKHVSCFLFELLEIESWTHINFCICMSHDLIFYWRSPFLKTLFKVPLLF